MTSTQLTRDDAIVALAQTVPPGRDVLSAMEMEQLREVTGRLSALQAEAGRQELARFRALRDRGLDPDQAALTEVLAGRVIIVTGGTGCIGSSLLGELTRYRPARLVSLSRGLTPAWEVVDGVEYRHVDIRDADELDRMVAQVRPDIVFHLAAQHNPALAEVDVSRTFSTNVVGSANVFGACRRHGAAVVHASTGKAMRPYSSDVYAASKKMSEWLLHDAMRDGTLRAAAARFTHVVDNSIIYRRLQTWIESDSPIRLHDPETFFYLQSAHEAAQLLLCASVALSDSELRLATIRDVGMPISLLDLAIGAMADQGDGVVPLYLCGREPGYDHSVYPGLYDPYLSGDRSPLINAFEAENCWTAPFCEEVDLCLVRADHDPGTLALIQNLGAAAMSDADPALLRKRAEECGWAVLTSVVAALPTGALARQLQLVGQVPAEEFAPRDRQILAVVGWELRRRGEIDDLSQIPHLATGRHAAAGQRDRADGTRIPTQVDRSAAKTRVGHELPVAAGAGAAVAAVAGGSVPTRRRADPPPFDINLDVGDDEKHFYFGPQARWYLVLRFVAFIGLMISLVRFTYSEARISALLIVIACLAIVSLISLYTSTRPRRMDLTDHRRVVSGWRYRSDSNAPSVDVFLPTAGEPLTVLENTYRRVAALDYPGVVSVYVLDDGARAEVADLAGTYGFTYLTRPDRGRLKKAGNLAFGYANSNGEVIAVLDADFAPRADYLLELVPYLDDESIGIVQSPQYFQTFGLTSWLQRAAGATQELFYRWVQPSRDAIDAPICVGTCALYRRASLAAAGGFAQIQHSEDVHTGVKILGAGYSVRYVPIVLSKGECPDSLSAFMSQQYRWCAGSMSLMTNADFRKMKLTFKQRLCFWSGFGYYITTALAAFAALVPPIFLLWFEPQAIRPENYLWLVPALLVYPLTRIMNVGDWRLNVLRVQLVYAYCHAVSIWDTYRGGLAEWVATGAAKRTPLTTKITRLMTVWISLTQAALWGGVVWVLITGALSFAQLWPLVVFSGITAYIQLPLLWITRRSPAPQPKPSTKAPRMTVTLPEKVA